MRSARAPTTPTAPQEAVGIQLSPSAVPLLVVQFFCYYHKGRRGLFRRNAYHNVAAQHDSERIFARALGIGLDAVIPHGAVVLL